MANNSFEISHINRNGTIGEMINTIEENFSSIFSHGGGPAGKDGKDGRDGRDGVNIEYIYTLCDVLKEGNQYPSYQNNENEFISFFDRVINSGSQSYNGTMWYNYPQSISRTRKNEYVLVRLKMEYGWKYQKTPILWAHWGEDGVDGNDVEYIYMITDHKLNDDELNYSIIKKEDMSSSEYQDIIYGINDFYPGKKWFNDSNKQIAKQTLIDFDIHISTNDFENRWDNYFGLYVDNYDWTDEPSGVDSEHKYEYVAMRKLISDGTIKYWSNFSKPSLWSNFGEDGVDGKDGKDGKTWYRKYARYEDRWGQFGSIVGIYQDGEEIKFKTANGSTKTARTEDTPSGADEDHCIEVMSEKLGVDGSWTTPVIISRQFSEDEVKSRINATISESLSDDNAELVGFIKEKAGQQVSETMGDYALSSTLDDYALKEDIPSLDGYVQNEDLSTAFEEYQADASEKRAKASTISANTTFKKNREGYLIYIDENKNSEFKSILEYYDYECENDPDFEYQKLNDENIGDFISHCIEIFQTTFTELASIKTEVGEKMSQAEIIAAIHPDGEEDDIIAAIFAEANERGSEITLNADKINLDANHKLVLNTDTFEINSSNFTLDDEGNVSMTGTINATGGTIGSNNKIIIDGNGIRVTDNYGKTSYLTTDGIQMNGSFNVKTAYVYKSIDDNSDSDDSIEIIKESYDIYPSECFDDLIKKFDFINFIDFSTNENENKVIINCSDSSLIGRHITLMSGTPLKDEIKNIISENDVNFIEDGDYTILQLNGDCKFYEDGNTSRKLKLCNECVELIGIGVKNLFKGFIVLKRFNVNTSYDQGHNLNCLGMIELCHHYESEDDRFTISISKQYSCSGNNCIINGSGHIIETPFYINNKSEVIAISDTPELKIETLIEHNKLKIFIDSLPQGVETMDMYYKIILLSTNNFSSLYSDSNVYPTLRDISENKNNEGWIEWSDYYVYHTPKFDKSFYYITSAGTISWYYYDNSSLEAKYEIKIHIDSITKNVKCYLNNYSTQYFTYTPESLTINEISQNEYTVDLGSVKLSKTKDEINLGISGSIGISEIRGGLIIELHSEESEEDSGNEISTYEIPLVLKF